MAEAIFVRTDAFEGPFDLLFHLIEKNEVDIYDIPIFLITEQYLEYMDSMAESLSNSDDAGMEAMSGFVVMAATLLEIKSKLLLPGKTKEGEEPEDPRAELATRLAELKRYKDIVPVLRDMEEYAAKFFYKPKDPTLPEGELSKPEINVGDSLGGLPLERLMALFGEVLSRRELKVDKIRADFGAIAKDTYTIAQKTAHLAALLRMYGRIGFFEAFGGDFDKNERTEKTRLEIIVTFLALLELIKTRRATVTQDGQFGEIYITGTDKLETDGDRGGN